MGLTGTNDSQPQDRVFSANEERVLVEVRAAILEAFEELGLDSTLRFTEHSILVDNDLTQAPEAVSAMLVDWNQLVRARSNIRYNFVAAVAESLGAIAVGQIPENWLLRSDGERSLPDDAWHNELNRAASNYREWNYRRELVDEIGSALLAEGPLPWPHGEGRERATALLLTGLQVGMGLDPLSLEDEEVFAGVVSRLREEVVLTQSFVTARSKERSATI